MDHSEPGLFDLPFEEPLRPVQRPLRGRNRQKWARTATAEVTVLDAGALLAAAAAEVQNSVTVGLPAGLDVADAEPGVVDGAAVGDAFDALGWLIWPTAGMDGPLDAGAFHIIEVEVDVTAESEARGSATWTVTVKLTDVDALRRLAIKAQPGAAGLIGDSLPVAWLHAVDPFAPLRSIPGITWRPGPVDVVHLPARVVGAG